MNSSGIDLMLWNSFMGKAYSISDGFKENGIGVLARACKDAGVNIAIKDPARIDFYTSFTKNDLTPRLSKIALRVFRKTHTEDAISLRREWNILQDALTSVIKEKMEKYITELAQMVHSDRVKVLGIKTW